MFSFYRPNITPKKKRSVIWNLITLLSINSCSVLSQDEKDENPKSTSAMVLSLVLRFTSNDAPTVLSRTANNGYDEFEDGYPFVGEKVTKLAIASSFQTQFNERIFFDLKSKTDSDVLNYLDAQKESCENDLLFLYWERGGKEIWVKINPKIGCK